jgi:hypothetical protein
VSVTASSDEGAHFKIVDLNPVMSVGDALDELRLIAIAGEEAEVRDRIAYLPV